MPMIPVTEGQLYYQLEGDAGLPVLVLSNSLGTDLGMWDAQVADFTRHFRVLRYDTRGHGRSTASPGPYHMDQLGGDLLTLLDQLGITRVHFCGLSMGGLIGQWLAVNAGHRLERLVLCNTAAKIGNDDGWNSRIETVNAGGEAAMRDLREASVARWFTPAFVEAEPNIVARITAMLATTSPDGYAANCAAIRDADFRDSLTGVVTPTLIVTGSADAVTTPDDGRAMQARLRHAGLVEFPAAHLSNVEMGDDFTKIVLGFLRASS